MSTEQERPVTVVLEDTPDLLNAVLACLGIRVLRVASVSRFWSHAARHVAGCCKVLDEKHDSKGRFYSKDYPDEDDEGDDDEHCPEGLYVFGAASLAPTEEGFVLADTNNHRFLVLNSNRDPLYELCEENICFPTVVVHANGFVVHAEAPGQQEWATLPLLSKRSLQESESDAVTTAHKDGVYQLTGSQLVTCMVAFNGAIFASVVEDARNRAVGAVLEYDISELSFTREFSDNVAMSMVGLGEELFQLVDTHVSAFNVKTQKRTRNFAVADHACCITAQHDRLFVGTKRLPHTRGMIHVILLDGTPLQKLTVFATGGPCDLCVAHGRLYCLCAAGFNEADMFWNGNRKMTSFTVLGGQEEMHILCSFAFIGPEKHF